MIKESKKLGSNVSFLGFEKKIKEFLRLEDGVVLNHGFKKAAMKLLSYL